MAYGAGSPAGPIPYGNAFIVQTPEIDAARNQIFAQQQQRRMYQQQEMSKLDPIMDREFAKIRSVDVPAFTDAYNTAKNIKKQILFDPRAQRDQNYHNQLNQKYNEAIANTFGIADKSAQYNQMSKDLMTTRRTHPDVYDDTFGDKLKTFMSTPYDKLEKTEYGDLTNPDNFRYQHNIDFQQLHTKAYGPEKEISTPAEKDPNDPLSTVTNFYKYGANPKQYHDNLVNQLAKLPTGEREAASAMQHYSPEMIAEINKQYYAPNPDKWTKTTGQPNPIPVEAVNPNSAADQYASTMAKLTWLNANTPTPVRTQRTPNRDATTDKSEAFKAQMQQNAFKQADYIQNVRNNQAIGRINLHRLYAKQDAAGQDALVDAHFDNEFKDAQKGQPLSFPTASGTPLVGFKVNPISVLSKELITKDDKGKASEPNGGYIVSPDGKTMAGVYLTTDKDGKTIVDDSRTKVKSVDNELKPVFKAFVAPKSKVPDVNKVPPVAPPKPLGNGLYENMFGKKKLQQ